MTVPASGAIGAETIARLFTAVRTGMIRIMHFPAHKRIGRLPSVTDPVATTVVVVANLVVVVTTAP